MTVLPKRIVTLADQEGAELFAQTGGSAPKHVHEFAVISGAWSQRQAPEAADDLRTKEEWVEAEPRIRISLPVCYLLT
jgi:hypothetical protein